MDLVSTAPSILRVMQQDDEALVSLLGYQDKPNDEARKPWAIPGFGVFGAGSAALAAVIAWKSIPAFKEELQGVSDLLGLGDKEAADKLEAVGLAGSKFEDNADVPDGLPRIAKEPEVKSLSNKVSRPEAEIPSIPTIQSSERVSKGLQIPRGSQYVPQGKLAAPNAQINDILKAAAQAEGIDYSTLYAVAGSESSFRSSAKASTSSATGLFQFTTSTWDYLVTKVYPDLGYSRRDRSDPKKSAVVAARYLNSIGRSLKRKLGHTPSVSEIYLGYFMGPTGAAHFLEALAKNPNALGSRAFPGPARANPNLFFDRGDRSKPLTLQQTMDRLSGKVTSYYAAATQVSRSTAVAESAPDVSQQGAVPVKGKIPAVSAVSQPVAVKAPDFDSIPGGAKGEARETAPIEIANKDGVSTGKLVTLPEKPVTEQKTYVRDSQGRLFVFNG